jgi:hypothetical protein
MQRASETIGALAGALAKAQTELVNPEKSLVATIREEGPRGREQTFRYAPLSSGLEIVRKVLGQHEDDMDAPDLQTAVGEPERPNANATTGPLNGGREKGPQATPPPEQATSARSSKQAPAKQPEGNLGLHASAKLRERLVAEIRLLSSTEHAAEWVRQSLVEKTRLRTADAAQVEAAFEAKLAHLAAFYAAGAEGQRANSVE